jgi:hypothetical protein
VHFHDDRGAYSVYRAGRHPAELARLLRRLARFGRHLRRFRARCLEIGQAAALAEDPHLLELYRRPARELIVELGLAELLGEVVGEVLYAVSFSALEAMSAFELLHLVRYLVVVPVHRFRVDAPRLCEGFAERIVHASVTAIEDAPGGYLVRTASAEIHAARVVVATPPAVTRSLLGLPEIKAPVRAFATRVRGRWRDRERFEEEVFPMGSDLMAVAHLEDGTAVVLSARPDPDLSAFVADSEVLGRHHWDPAFHLGPEILWPAELRPGLYIAGDHNVCGLEDAYLGGLFAARRILQLV